MRDPKRIKVILNLIEEYWNDNPDYRFGQMLINLGVSPDSTHFWNISDGDLLIWLENRKRERKKEDEKNSKGNKH